MTTDELIEKAAKAIWVTRNGGDSAWAEMAWSELTAPDDWNREALDALDEARAAFTVFEQAQAEWDGWEYEHRDYVIAVPQRLSPRLRASLIDFAKDRIQAVWNDVGETDAATLAENVVSAQEFAWLSAQVPIVTDERVEAGARALSPNAWVDGAWITSTRQADAQRYATRRARAVLEAALEGEA